MTCSQSTTNFVEDFSLPVIQSVTTTSATDCNNDGSITINATGTYPLLYSVDEINWQTSNSFTNLTGGAYHPAVKYDLDIYCFTGYGSVDIPGTPIPQLLGVLPYHPAAGITTGDIQIFMKAGTGTYLFDKVGTAGTNTDGIFEVSTGTSHQFRIRNFDGTCPIFVEAELDNSKRCDGVIFNSQSDLNDFALNNPTCTYMDGEVFIESTDINDPIVSLSPLSNINYISSLLSIKSDHDSDLNHAEGLGQLLKIGSGITDYLEIIELETLDGLESLSEISGNLDIRGGEFIGETGMTSISGLQNLRSIGGEMIIQRTELTTLSGLDHLSYVGTGINLQDNDLASLKGLENIVVVNGDLYIIQSGGQGTYNRIYSFQGLNNLTNVTGTLSLSGRGFRSFEGLDNLQTIGGSFDLYSSSDLETVQGLHNLQSVGELFLFLPYSNKFQDNLDGFQNLGNIGSNFVVGGTNIATLACPPLLNSVGGLSINSNHSLTSFGTIDNIPNILGAVTISSNNALENLNGLENLSTLPNNLTIQNNDALTSLSGLENLSLLEGDLRIEGNELLSNLEGLNSLSNINGRLIIGGSSSFDNENPNLETLTGLDVLEFVGGDVSIVANYSLSTLNGLLNLNNYNGNLSIYHNLNLSSCAIDAICDRLQTNPSHATIYSNASGCTSTNEVSAGCDCIIDGLTITSQSQIDNFKNIYPGCSVVQGHLVIEEAVTGNITSLAGLNQLLEMEGLTIRNNSNLMTLAGLENLSKIEGSGLNIYNNSSLTSMEGLNNLQTVAADDAVISDNPALSSLSGLENLAQVDNLIISNNNLLQDLTGLGGLMSIIGFEISNNEALVSLAGLHPSIEQIVSLFLFDNSQLAELVNFNQPNIFSSININNCNSLTNVNGLENVTSLSDLNLSYNANLFDLIGLANLESISGTLILSGNPSLNTLSNLQKLNSIDGNTMWIRDNTNLSFCAVEAICNFTGTAIIENNASGCNNETEINNACSALPLALLDFYLKPHNTDILLSWKARQEIPIAYYEIEHSTDGKTFQNIGKIAALLIDENNQVYQFLHQNPAKTTHYYRLKIVEDNGNYDYSNIISLSLKEDKKNMLRLFPNPVKEVIQLSLPKHITISSSLEVKIFNVLGELLLEEEITEFALDVSLLPKGTYWIQAKMDNEVWKMPFIKI